MGFWGGWDSIKLTSAPASALCQYLLMVALCFLPKWKGSGRYCKKLFTGWLLCTRKPFTGCFATEILLTRENSSFLLFVNLFKSAVLAPQTNKATGACELASRNDPLLIIHSSLTKPSDNVCFPTLIPPTMTSGCLFGCPLYKPA